MAPAALNGPTSARRRPSSPAKKAWNEERLDIPSILIGGGQENASTTRHDIEEGRVPQRKRSEGAHTQSRDRSNSRRQNKNSTEILQQHSLKGGNKEADMERNISTREGRHFTVANVGNNGKIYLRYVNLNSPRNGRDTSSASPVQ